MLNKIRKNMGTDPSFFSPNVCGNVFEPVKKKKKFFSALNDFKLAQLFALRKLVGTFLPINLIRSVIWCVTVYDKNKD